MVSIVLVDDQLVVREGLAVLLDAHPELHIVGQCSDGLAAVEMITSLAPDFAILDLNHQGLHGIEVIRKVVKRTVPVNCWCSRWSATKR